MTVYGYLRVSTDKQDCDNQKIGVEALAEKLGLPIESWIIDNGVSGTKEPEKRFFRARLSKTFFFYLDENFSVYQVLFPHFLS